MDWVLWMFELKVVNLAEDKKVDCDPAPERNILARRRDSSRKMKDERLGAQRNGVSGRCGCGGESSLPAHEGRKEG
jgi:hypothetical protein